MRPILPLLAAAALLAPTATAQTSTASAVEAQDEWEPIDFANLMLMDLADGKRVVIELAPAFAPSHVANIKALVRAGWFDRHAAIVRVQENYVVQWGDPTSKAPLPEGIIARPTDGYERPGVPADFRPLPFPDAYGATVGHAGNWPVATDGRQHWLPHCPTMVGVGRDLPPDTGTGAALYAVIGHGPRHLDRNIALVGRVVDGMANLSSLPRGEGDLAFYRDAAQRLPIRSVSLAVDLPPAERPRYEVRRTASDSFQRWIERRANPQHAFFIRPAGGADICNLLPPVRRLN